MKKILIFALSLVALEPSLAEEVSAVKKAPEEKQNPQIDVGGFFLVSQEAAKHRENRLVTIEKFNTMSQEKGTIILDSRSAAAFKASHIKGAININFSDFTKEKLEKLIPDKNTRILIYCNNNFKVSKEEENLQIPPKLAPLALNIPTFINLYGYGYKNVYELSSTLNPKDPRANLVGDAL